MSQYSQAELLVLGSLSRINLHPKHQYQIDKMCVDFAFPEQKIAIEIDGPHHNTTRNHQKDANRDAFLQIKG